MHKNQPLYVLGHRVAKTHVIPLGCALLAALSSAAQAAAYRYYRFELISLSSGTFAQLSEFTMSKNGQNLNLVAVNPEITTPLATGQNGTAVDMVPVTMTGGDRAVDATQGAIRIVDGSTATKWTTVTTYNNNDGRFLKFDFGTPVEIDGYNFATANDTATNTGRNPKSWRLAGSNDGETWTTLDRRLDQVLPTTNFTYMGGYTANGTFPISIFSFGLSDGQVPIVKNGQAMSMYWDTYDDDQEEAETTTITPSIGSGTLEPFGYDVAFTPPAGADTTYTLTAVNGGNTATRTLQVRSVAGGTSTYRYYRYTPLRTRSGGPQTQLAEFAFYRNGAPLNLRATNAIPAQTTGSNHTNDSVLNVTVTNPGGSSDTAAATGATRLVDGYTTDLPSADGTTTLVSRYIDNFSQPVVFAFEAPVTIDSYRFTTSNEKTTADPVRWILEGSADGANWTLIDNVTAFSYPTPADRNVTTQIFPLPGSSLKTQIESVPAYTWTGLVDNNYTTSGNWDTAAVPAESNDIAIRSGQPTYTGDLVRSAVSTISDNGSLTTTGRLTNKGRMDVTSGSVSVTGAYFVVGSGSPALVNQTGGTVTATVSSGFLLSDDGAAGGSGYKLSGTGVLNVTTSGNGASSPLYNFHIGKAGYGDSFEMTGGTANLNAVGANNIYLSRASKMSISGGAFTATNYTAMTIGFEGLNSTSTLDISGGSLNLVGTPLNVGANYNGVLTLRGGSLAISRELQIGMATGTGVVTMSGGTLTTTAILASTNGTFNFNGGTILLTGDQRGLLTQTWFKAITGTSATYNAAQNLTTIAVGDAPPTTAYETWISTSGLSGTNATALADPDGDGIPNLLEFALNGDPATAASRGRTGNVIASGTGVLTLAVRSGAGFTTNSDGSQTAVVDGIRYTIRGSRDLVTWTAEIEPVTPAVTTGVTNPDAGWELRSFRLKAVTGAPPRGFMDLQVTDLP